MENYRGDAMREIDGGIDGGIDGKLYREPQSPARVHKQQAVCINFLYRVLASLRIMDSAASRQHRSMSIVFSRASHEKGKLSAAVRAARSSAL